jgi:hypothetical protein|nr:MAG TPA_asm: Head fiber protein [Caudoviricetes sp.]
MAVDMNKLLDGNGLLFALQGFMTKVTALLGNKVDKVSGKGLSTNDYTTAEKTKLSGIATGANNYTLPTASSTTLGGVKTGSNITNTDGTLSLTKANVTAALGYTPPTKDTNTWTPFKGATASAAGTAGYVPAPAAGDQEKFFKADGTFAVPKNTTYGVVSDSYNGLMSSDDYKKLKAFGDASTYATTAYVGQQISAAGHVSKKIVTALPDPSAAADNVIYLIKKSSGSGSNLYDEYMLIDGKLELVGDSATKIDTLTNADITEILSKV